MLDKGFENDIRNIISNTLSSPERQTLMCKVFNILSLLDVTSIFYFFS